MKRALSVVLTLAMLLSLVTVFVVTPVSAATVIKNTAPAIRANVNDTITLSNYSVVFDGDTTATSDITWKNGDTTVTTFKPTAKGVTKLTATSGSKSKDIYVVAKNASDSEYVLYEASLADYSVAQLKSAGWSFTAESRASKDSDGSLLLSNSGKYDAHAAYLPAWLGDFGDYKISADIKFKSFAEDDKTRWFSLIMRAENRNLVAHYTHAAFRGNNTVDNGIEFAERYADASGTEAWNIANKTAGSYSSLTDAYRNFSLLAVDTTFCQELEGKQALYMGANAYAAAAKKIVKKGYLGIQASGCSIVVKSVKITLEDVAPQEIINSKLIYNNYHDISNLVNPIANVQRVSTVNADSLKKLSVAYIDLTTGIDAKEAFKACIDNKVVPTFFVGNNSHVDAIINASVEFGCIDATVISARKSLLARIRSHSSAYAMRTGLVVDLSEEMADGVMTDYEADAIRLNVRAVPASFMVIKSRYATKQAVAELQEMALAVWVDIASEPDTDAFKVEAMKAITAGANGLISDSAAGVSSLANTHFMDKAFTRTPITIGHRGNPGVAPENTIESFQAAYDNGGDVFELDVECTSDGVIVVLHDSTLTRTTTYTGSTSIRNMTWAEAQKYYVLAKDGTSTGKPIPTLKEVLDWAKGKDIKIFVEFKDSSSTCVKGTMKDIVERGMTQQVDIISFDPVALRLARGEVSGISTGYLIGNKVVGSTYVMALKLFEEKISKAQQEWSTINCGSYSNEVTNLTVQVATDRGMTMWPWTYGYSNTSTAFFDCPDGITTDNMEVMKDMVKVVHAKDIVLDAGQTYEGGAFTSETYGNAITEVSATDTIVSVIAGDSVKVENGKLVAVKDGVSTVVLAYKTKTYLGAEYVVYSQPVKVIVGDVDPSDPSYPSDEPSEDTDEDASIPEDAENLALGQQYTTTLGAISSYPDTGNKELTDGIIVTNQNIASTYYSDKNWVGFNVSGADNRNFDIIMPIGDGVNASKLYAVSANIGTKGCTAGVYEPNLEVYYSVDGKEWLEFGYYEYRSYNEQIEPAHMVDIIRSEPVKANFIKINVSHPQYNLMWFGEIQAWGIKGVEGDDEEPSVPVDPSEPSEPSESSDPSESFPPVDPSDSSDPSDPSDSSDPSQDSSDPSDPVDPDPDDKDPVEPDAVTGDINGNDEIDSMDYVLLKRAYFGTYKLKDISIGDINGNGEIDSMDYVYLRRAYFGTYKIK